MSVNVADEGNQDVRMLSPTTPEKKKGDRPAIEETPRSARTDASDLKQTIARKAAAIEMDSEMVSCSLATFREHYLPFNPDNVHVEACIKYLETKNVLGHDTSGQQRFAAFKSKPSELPGTGDVIFEPLNDICLAIEGYDWHLDRTQGAGDVRQQGFTLKQTPNKTTLSEVMGSNHRTDAFFVPHSSLADKKYITSDVAVSAEFKTKFTISNRQDDREKVLGAANHILNNDPRRMFTYGMTIENDQMTLWYFSRSHSAKSESFDFVTNTPAVVAIFLSFVFATEQEMGYDPTVHRCTEQGTIGYVYEVMDDKHKRYFKTLKCLHEYRSTCITGRMARVWSVIEVASPTALSQVTGSAIVLKDLWLDQGAETEKNIQRAIFQDIEQFAASMGGNSLQITGFDLDMVNHLQDCFANRKYKKYFLEIICDHQGHVSRAVPPSAKPERGIFVPEMSQANKSSSAVLRSTPGRTHGDPTRPPSQTPPQTSHATTIPRRFLPKQQYRVVFKEICEPLHRVKKLSDVIGTVRQCLVALQLLYCAGWVHRDISSGNILLYESGSGISVKLADLEYAKRFLSDKSSHDPKTGTPYFMPFEIQTRTHLFRAAPRAGNEQLMKMYGLTPRPALSLGPVRYNFQHDVESLWWIVLWFITTRVNCKDSRTWATGVFENTVAPSLERRAILEGDKIDGLEKNLVESLRPLSPHMVNSLGMLVEAYTNREKERHIEDLASYSSVYKYMDIALGFMHNLCKEAPEITVFPQPAPVVSTSNAEDEDHPANDALEDQASADDEGQQDDCPPKKRFREE